jgi:rhodanese-related sulfurtransferase
LLIHLQEYAAVLQEKQHILLDVREKIQYDICSLPNAWNIFEHVVCTKEDI